MKSEVDRLFNVIRGRKKNTEPENGENIVVIPYL